MSDDEEGHPPRRRGPGNVDALWERVESHSTLIRNLTVEMSDAFRDMRAETTSQLSALAASISKQVEGNASSIERIAGKIDTTAAAAAERQRPQYLALFAGIISAIGVSVTVIQWQEGQRDKPVDEKLLSLQSAIGDLTKNVSTSFGEVGRNTVSQQQFQMATDYRDKLTAAYTAGRDTVRGQMQKEIELLDSEQKHTADTVVPRNELEFHWLANDKRDTAIEQSIDAINRRIDNLAPAGDYIRTMNERQHELELRVYGEHH